MTKHEIIEKIRKSIERIFDENGHQMVQSVAEDTVLIESDLGIDSLDLAAIVVELSEVTGKDPFQNGFIEFRTVGELSDLYCDKSGS